MYFLDSGMICIIGSASWSQKTQYPPSHPNRAKARGYDRGDDCGEWER